MERVAQGRLCVYRVGVSEAIPSKRKEGGEKGERQRCRGRRRHEKEEEEEEGDDLKKQTGK